MSVKVSYSANFVNSDDFADLTVDKIYDKTEAALGLPSKSSLSVNVDSESEDFDYKVEDGQEVEFEKASGSKGC